MLAWWRRLWRRPLTPPKIAKMSRLAANPFAQPDVRSRQLERLLEDGSPAALAGALGRFAADAQGQIADEEEKTWLVEALCERGEAAEAALASYIRGGQRLAHALTAYRRLAGDAKAAALMVQVLGDHRPDDHRSSSAKLQLMAALGECAPVATCRDALAPFLADHSDDVRWAVLGWLAQHHQDPAVQGEAEVHLAGPLAALVAPGAASPRIARQAARVLAQLGWRLPGGAAGLDPCLDDAFALGAGGKVVAQPAAP